VAALVGPAIVERRVGIAGDRDLRAERRDPAFRKGQGNPGVSGLARNEIEGADRRGTEHRAIGVVVHRKTLRIVPQRGDGIAVEIGHHRGPVIATADADDAGRLDEFVHQPAIDRLLLVGVVVVHIAGEGFGPLEPKRLQQVRVVRQQAGVEQRIGRRRVFGGNKTGLVLRVCREWVGPKIVVEADVFAKNDDDVLDRRLRR
jgi:hypothetical protein